MAAIKDADLMIKLWSALTEDQTTGDDTHTSKRLRGFSSINSSRKRNSSVPLSIDAGRMLSHEADILNDSADEVSMDEMTDSQFFNALRLQYLQDQGE